MAPQLRSPAKRRKPYGEEPSDDSELSEIDELEETTLAEPEEDEDDDDDDDDGDDESSDSATPEGEIEESYISDDPQDISDDDDDEDEDDGDDDEDEDSDMRPLTKTVVHRAVGGARRKAAAAKPAAKPKTTVAPKKVGKRARAVASVSPPQKIRQLPQRTTHARPSSSTAIGTRSSSFHPQGKTAASTRQTRPTATTSGATTATSTAAISAATATSGARTSLTNKPPTIKLKIGKARLREITSAWTPPPGATDTGAPPTAAATPESIAAPGPRSTSAMPRGRKVVQEDSDDADEEEDEEDEDDGDEDESRLGEEREPDDELGDEDAEGETDDEMLDSDEDTGVTPGTDFMSRTGTPDMSRLTNRQRTRLGDITTADLLELPNAFEKPGANKVVVSLSAQEQELKRAEMARRRKNLTDQKLEEEKMETINRLLKKQTPKMRGRGRATGDATPADQSGDTAMAGAEPPPAPTMVRWISDKSGIRLAVPGSWLEGPAGRQFKPRTEPESMRNVRRKLVEGV